MSIVPTGREAEPLVKHPWSKCVPNTAFGVSLGLAGTSISWKAIATTPFTAVLGSGGNWFFWLSGWAAFALIFLLYLAKAVLHPSTVWKEVPHQQTRTRIIYLKPAAAVASRGTDLRLCCGDGSGSIQSGATSLLVLIFLC